MPQYAHFDHTAAAPQPVLGWYDTDFAEYPDQPDAADLFEMTPEQWAARSLEPCAIDNGEIIVLPPPPLTADQELGTRKANGIAITCTSDATINATYALDDRTVATVGSIARDVASGLDFPAGATTYDQPDIDGVAHTFTEPQWIALYKAMRDLVSALGAQRDIMAGGGSPVWPPQTATIP
jgi:hypothetical protein